ncbi:hypothetical protein MMC21_006384 [Puttea exsequens]|nr:hypothetical protein [Puttea exsequens]
MPSISSNSSIGVISNLVYSLLLRATLSIEVNTPLSSPETSVELIRHTQHASERYPSIFQPTEYFRPVHFDQAIPPGLHVRMNLATGLKEARLNVPEPYSPSADLIIIDSSPRSGYEEEVEQTLPDTPQAGALHYQTGPERDVPYIPPHFDPNESALFASSVSIVQEPSHASAKDLSSALEILTDLCHSHHWGLTLVENDRLVRYLLRPAERLRYRQTQSEALLLLGTAVQNNPEALQALLDHDLTPTLMALILDFLQKPAAVVDLSLHRRALFLLSQLANDASQLHRFLAEGGLDVLYTLFDDRPQAVTTSSNVVMSIGEGHDKLRAKIANFIHDHVLPAFDGDKGQ